MNYKIDPTTKLIDDYMLRNAEIQHGDLDIESLSYDEILETALEEIYPDENEYVEIY